MDAGPKEGGPSTQGTGAGSMRARSARDQVHRRDLAEVDLADVGGAAVVIGGADVPEAGALVPSEGDVRRLAVLQDLATENVRPPIVVVRRRDVERDHGVAGLVVDGEVL